MQEIRFNQPVPIQPEVSKQITSNQEPKKDKNKSKFFSFVLLVLKLVLILAFIYAGLVGSRYFFGQSKVNDNYSAVFLNNDQVYFGKIFENKRDLIILREVYYLQNTGTNLAPDGASLQGSNFTLVKLGQELHGPTDEMYINKNNMLFYEHLRSDSQVVKTIEDYKNK